MRLVGNRYAIFGAGNVGRQALKQLGNNEVAFFVDNDERKEGSFIENVPVRSFAHVKDKLGKYPLIVAVSEKYISEIVQQLTANGLSFKTLSQLMMERTRKRILQRPDYLGIYQRAIGWIMSHMVNGNCIINSTQIPKGYPEVTGYYIPTLLTWGYRDIAASFGKWLCDIQKSDGSWYDVNDEEPYVFDSGQVLKGLIAIKKSIQGTGLHFAYSESELDDHILHGVDWILSNMQQDGRLTTPSTADWGDKRTCSELVHIYCLQPIMEVADIYGRPEYREKAGKILQYYLQHHREDILHFDLLSHFYSYALEALVDLGEGDLAREAMQQTEVLQNNIGFVPAYKDVHWCCSTGLFQQALVWYKLGDIKNGDKAFEYACKLQNISGGWYGSYPNPDYPEERPEYFPDSEISWAVKYFLDALYWKNKADFNAMSSDFKQKYDKMDGRYQTVKGAVTAIKSSDAKILDVGCGKGAYLHNLMSDAPDVSYSAVDISTQVMAYIADTEIEQREGSLTAIPFPDDTFDLVYTTEALEHAVDIDSAVRELCRVTKPGGTVLIIDKNKAKLGAMDICDWEQWFDVDCLQSKLAKYAEKAWVKDNIAYDGGMSDGLFCAWFACVK